MTKKFPFLMVFLGAVFALSLFTFSPVYAEKMTDSDDTLLTLSGSIAEVDAEGRKVTLTWTHEDMNMKSKEEDITMTVAGNAAITKETEAIELDDLEEGDEVTVRYLPDAIPLPQILSITVTE